MVKGLDIFRTHFDGDADQFVLIGGTAATLAMEDAGLEFRATKDLDIVLHIEALEPAFGSSFWEFIEKGDYQIRETSETGKPVLYRFQKKISVVYRYAHDLVNEFPPIDKKWRCPISSSRSHSLWVIPAPGKSIDEFAMKTRWPTLGSRLRKDGGDV